MATEGVTGTRPQVFVVDRQASYVSMPDGKRAKWAMAGHTCLLLLLGVALLGLTVEAFFIYNLYKRIENLSGPKTSAQQGEALTSLVKSTATYTAPLRARPRRFNHHPHPPSVEPLESHQDRTGTMWSPESNEISTMSPHTDQFQRPFAQLIGPNPRKGITSSAGRNSVVQWIHNGGETVLSGMGYRNGSLLVDSEGHYYLYSSLTFNASDECTLIVHQVMKVTKAYGQPIELMKSKSYRCQNPDNENKKPARMGRDYVWNSFLAGIFHLQAGDQIYVLLDDISKMKAFTTGNRMGAFMISP